MILLSRLLTEIVTDLRGEETFMKLSTITLAMALALGAHPALAQDGKAPALPPTALDAAPIPPTEVLPDKSIVFRLAAPNANAAEVVINGEGFGRYPMTKGADGVWSVKLGPLPSEMYMYNFNLDGARLPYASVIVPAEAPRPYEVQAVPRGSLTHQPYHSNVQNRWRNMIVYLPPQYYAEPNRHFPVLYLFAGMGEDEWLLDGNGNVILDNLIAQGKAQPMIVVMPNNTTGPHPVPALENAAIMEKELETEIMPMVERNFRTVADRDHRGIAGVSFGGGTAFTLGSRHLDQFAYVGEFSTGAFGGGDKTAFAPGYAAFDPNNITPNLYAKYADPATRPKLLFMSVGAADNRAPYQKQVSETFAQKGYTPVFHVYPGQHEWKAFRASLIDMLPLLFR
jgi:enterochelin esterase-like enzyme